MSSPRVLAEDVDVLTVGRISVDLYAREAGVGFEEQQTFSKSVGGSPTNVAIAAARLGLSAAVATKVGGDGFGVYVRSALERWGVDTRYVGVQADGLTPLALAALDPPESPRVAFYRGPAAPDTTLVAADVPEQVIAELPLLWMSFSALSTGSTADAGWTWLAQRARRAHTVLDLDYRPALWRDAEVARAAAQRAISHATVTVGNREECAIALGTDDPDAAADRLLDLGVWLAIVKCGGDGVLLATGEDRVRLAPLPITVVCGLGAGDAFGGALCVGLLSDWDLPRIGRLANAAGAIVSTRLTCADAMPTMSELTAMLEGAA